MFAFFICAVIGSGLNSSLIESPWRILNKAPLLSEWIREWGEYRLRFHIHMVNIQSFSESSGEQKYGMGGERHKNWKINYVRLWAFWRQLSYLSELSSNGQALVWKWISSSESDYRLKTEPEVLRGCSRVFLRGRELGSVVQTFDLQNLGVWQDEESRGRKKMRQEMKSRERGSQKKKELHARKQ